MKRSTPKVSVSLLALCSLLFSVSAGSAATGSFTIATGGKGEFENVPIFMTYERLNRQGWSIKEIAIAPSEATVEAVARGEAQFGKASAASVLKAIQAGGKVRIVAETVGNFFVVVSTAGIDGCKALDGKRWAFHSPGAGTTGMTKSWLEKNCPNAAPQIMFLPGSENRAAALVAGQIDLAVLVMSAWATLKIQHPGKFKLFLNYAKDLPDLQTISFFANTDYLKEHRQVVTEFMTELVKTYRQINENPSLFIEAAERYAEEEKSLIPALGQVYIEEGLFDPNLGLSKEKAKYSIDYYTSTGQLKPGLTVDQAYDLGPLEDALSDLGGR